MCVEWLSGSQLLLCYLTVRIHCVDQKGRLIFVVYKQEILAISLGNVQRFKAIFKFLIS